MHDVRRSASYNIDRPVYKDDSGGSCGCGDKCDVMNRKWSARRCVCVCVFNTCGVSRTHRHTHTEECSAPAKSKKPCLAVLATMTALSSQFFHKF